MQNPTKHSLIYQKCTFDDLIDGWNELNIQLDLVRVLELFLYVSMSKLKGIDVSETYKFEPGVIDFLKICYWYSRLRRVPTFVHKIRELRARLTKKLLRKLESNKISVNYEGLSNEGIQKTISNRIRELGKKGMNIQSTKQLLNEYYDFVRVTISELMYPSLAEEYDHEIDFEPRYQDFDFDMIVDDLPFQIKTLIPVKYFPVSTSDIAKAQKYNEEVDQIGYLYRNNKLNKSYVERRVLDYVKKSCISQINKSLEQKAKIVILDGIGTAEGFLLNQLFADYEIYIKFQYSLTKSVANDSHFVNVIFTSAAYDHNYRISTLPMRIPVKDNKVEE